MEPSQQGTCRIAGAVLPDSAALDAHAVFLLKVSEDGKDRTVHRSYQDIQALQKKRAVSTRGDFPATRLRKLLVRAPWLEDGDGWHSEMSKALHLVNQWICSIEPALLLRFCDEGAHEAERLVLQQRLLSEKHARKLQQYFMSAVNMQFVIAEALKSLNKRTVFVEPSCGDGRLLLAMAAHSEAKAVAGCELDTALAESAATAVSAFSSKCCVHAGNFLATTRKDFSPLSKTEEDIDCNEIVLFGGPPYTHGGGDGSLQASGDPSSDTGRDLPLLFVCHAAAALKARKMVLLLPPRCGEPVFIERTKLAIKEAEAGDGLCSAADAWDVVTVPAPSNEFDFCGRLIRQPSVIQIWTHSSSSRDEEDMEDTSNADVNTKEDDDGSPPSSKKIKV